MTSRANIASDDAARWLIRQEEPGWSLEQQAELDQWLNESPLHRVAYLRQREGWRAADRIASLGIVIPPANLPSPSSRPRRWAGWAIAASLAIVSIGTLGWVEHRLTMRVPAAAQEYHTRVGGRSVVPLSDGSKVELNTATAVRAVVSNWKREIWLDRGEAYFEVAHRDDMPFVVHAGSRTVTVLGTKFSIRRDDSKVTVSVIEGRVRVDDADNPDAIRSAIISAGDMAIAREASTLVAVRAEDKVEKSLAWREGMLAFTDTTLADVAREFNRYHPRPMVMADSTTADIRIDGAFQASNVDAFIRLLHDAYGLKIVKEPDRIKISQP